MASNDGRAPAGRPRASSIPPSPTAAPVGTPNGDGTRTVTLPVSRLLRAFGNSNPALNEALAAINLNGAEVANADVTATVNLSDGPNPSILGGTLNFGDGNTFDVAHDALPVGSEADLQSSDHSTRMAALTAGLPFQNIRQTPVVLPRIPAHIANARTATFSHRTTAPASPSGETVRTTINNMHLVRTSEPNTPSAASPNQQNAPVLSPTAARVHEFLRETATQATPTIRSSTTDVASRRATVSGSPNIDQRPATVAGPTPPTASFSISEGPPLPPPRRTLPVNLAALSANTSGVGPRISPTAGLLVVSPREARRMEREAEEAGEQIATQNGELLPYVARGILGRVGGTPRTPRVERFGVTPGAEGGQLASSSEITAATADETSARATTNSLNVVPAANNTPVSSARTSAVRETVQVPTQPEHAPGGVLSVSPLTDEAVGVYHPDYIRALQVSRRYVEEMAGLQPTGDRASETNRMRTFMDNFYRDITEATSVPALNPDPQNVRATLTNAERGVNNSGTTSTSQNAQTVQQPESQTFTIRTPTGETATSVMQGASSFTITRTSPATQTTAATAGGAAQGGVAQQQEEETEELNFTGDAVIPFEAVPHRAGSVSTRGPETPQMMPETAPVSMEETEALSMLSDTVLEPVTESELPPALAGLPISAISRRVPRQRSQGISPRTPSVAQSSAAATDVSSPSTEQGVSPAAPSGNTDGLSIHSSNSRRGQKSSFEIKPPANWPRETRWRLQQRERNIEAHLQAKNSTRYKFPLRTTDGFRLCEKIQKHPNKNQDWYCYKKNTSCVFTCPCAHPMKPVFYDSECPVPVEGPRDLPKIGKDIRITEHPKLPERIFEKDHPEPPPSSFFISLFCPARARFPSRVHPNGGKQGQEGSVSSSPGAEENTNKAPQSVELVQRAEAQQPGDSGSDASSAIASSPGDGSPRNVKVQSAGAEVEASQRTEDDAKEPQATPFLICSKCNFQVTEAMCCDECDFRVCMVCLRYNYYASRLDTFCHSTVWRAIVTVCHVLRFFIVDLAVFT